MTVTDVGERVGYLVESEGAVDVEYNVPSDAEVGEGRRNGRGLVRTASMPSFRQLVSRPAIQPTVITCTSARTGPPTQR